MINRAMTGRRAGFFQFPGVISRKRQDRAGFTLVELLVVMSIIGILVGLIVGIAGYASKKSAMSEAQADISRLYQIMDEYRSVYGSYPVNNGAAGSSITINIDALDGAIIRAITNAPGEIEAVDMPFIDPWGNPYQYTALRNTTAAGSPSYQIEIYSKGLDATDSSDDISLREQ